MPYADRRPHTQTQFLTFVGSFAKLMHHHHHHHHLLSQLLRPLPPRSRRRSPSPPSMPSCGPSGAAPAPLAPVSVGDHQVSLVLLLRAPLPRECPSLPPSMMPGWVRLSLREQGVRMTAAIGLQRGSVTADRLPSCRPELQALMQQETLRPLRRPELR